MAAWGTVPDWVGALAAAGAFAGTILLLKRETDTRRREVDQEERAQARLVSCWVEPGAPRVSVRNGSSEPIYEAMVYIDRIEEPPPFIYLDAIPPESVVTKSWNPPDQGHEPLPALFFYDSAGVAWHRERDGELRRAPIRLQDNL